MALKTCVSVAESTPASAIKSLERALQKSDYVEMRLDFLRPSEVPKTLERAKKHLKKCVCTLRPKNEGGRFSGTEKERISILKLVAEYNPYLVDVEFNTLEKNKSLLNYLRKTNTPILVSWHDFKKTPPTPALLAKLQKMRRHGKFVKIVTTANSIRDTASVLSLYKKHGTGLIAFAM